LAHDINPGLSHLNGHGRYSLTLGQLPTAAAQLQSRSEESATAALEGSTGSMAVVAGIADAVVLDDRAAGLA